MRCKILGGTNDMEISKKEAMSEVPRRHQARTREIVVPRSPSNLPYASGQGPRDVVPSGAVTVGHVPSEYIASKICATAPFIMVLFTQALMNLIRSLQCLE